ncbi:Crp/Fnr family transcriptional regulator [Dyadobacter sp. MSC1_007]|jgi:CRP-like cAMP-binding protein|uniref:Crp/Fnr family transcriptional regulator n=1 Tax=Dyadobacter sp. MSC1_007 TaxID=2909264 RepID=UPI00202F05C8|nr:Crp/Fnr family transcriptional regulator [Dyadobacter sp. MSC1_007]
MGYLKQYYERLVALPESEWQFIASNFVRKEFQRGETITSRNNIEQYLYFLETGIVRFFIPKEEGELTFNFNFEKEFTGSYDSFLSRTPSQCTLQAITSTISWQISYESLQNIYTQTQVGNYLGRMVAEQLLLMKGKRELSLVNHNAKERYLNLFTEQPQILRNVPLKYVASYIGITPQALSRIRRQIS